MKYKDLGDSDQEVDYFPFSKKQTFTKVKGTGKVSSILKPDSPKNLIDMIEGFFTSLVESEVEMQYVTF